MPTEPSTFSFNRITDTDGFVAATTRAEVAITLLASIALAGIVLLILRTRHLLYPNTRYHLLLNTATVLTILLSMTAVGFVYETAFDPWHYVPIWCWPPAPLYRTVFLLVAPVTAGVSYLLNRARADEKTPI